MNEYQGAVLVNCTELAAREGLKGRRTAGGRGRWHCPFHEDDRGSFVTYPARDGLKSHFYCFGCCTSGDAIDMYADIHGVNITDAARQLCKDWGIPYEEKQYPDDEHSRKRRKRK